MEDSGNSQYPDFCGKLGLGEDVMEEGKVLLEKILALGIAPDTASKVCLTPHTPYSETPTRLSHGAGAWRSGQVGEGR